MRRLLFIALVGCGRVVADAADASAIGDASLADAENSALLAACDQYYDARYTRCGGPRVPSGEEARIKSRFEQVCLNEVALPGSGVTQTTLVACASALELSECGSPYGPPAACDFRGTVQGGGSCTDGIQCASGACIDNQDIPSPAGVTWPTKCGTCEPVVGVGELCGASTFSARCDPNALCLHDQQASADAGSPTNRCTPITYGDVGASCDGLASSCALGLYCAAQTGQCAVLGASGAPCGEGPNAYPGGCAAPLACVGAPGSYTCNTGSLGAACTSIFDCAAGLSCVPSSSSTSSGTCQPFTWASPQQPCDGHSVRCLIGVCRFPMGSTCPAIVPDGQPCQSTDTCDTFSECFAVGSTADSGFAYSGTCELHDTTVCRD